MRRLLVLALGTLFVGASSASAFAENVFSVPLDRSIRITLPAGSKRIMLGNAGIADITVLDRRTAILLGRTIGETNLLILDDQGRTLLDQVLMVTDSARGRVSMITGPIRAGEANGVATISNFACSPLCARYPLPGETNSEQGSADPSAGRAGANRAAAGASGSASQGSGAAMGGIPQALGSVASASRALVP